MASTVYEREISFASQSIHSTLRPYSPHTVDFYDERFESFRERVNVVLVGENTNKECPAH